MSWETPSGLDFCREVTGAPGLPSGMCHHGQSFWKNEPSREPSGRTPLPSPPFRAHLDHSTLAVRFLAGISLGLASTLLGGQRPASSLLRGQAPEKCLQLGPGPQVPLTLAAPHGKGQPLRRVRFGQWGCWQEQTGAMRGTGTSPCFPQPEDLHGSTVPTRHHQGARESSGRPEVPDDRAGVCPPVAPKAGGLHKALVRCSGQGALRPDNSLTLHLPDGPLRPLPADSIQALLLLLLPLPFCQSPRAQVLKIHLGN